MENAIADITIIKPKVPLSTIPLFKSIKFKTIDKAVDTNIAITAIVTVEGRELRNADILKPLITL